MRANGLIFQLHARRGVSGLHASVRRGEHRRDGRPGCGGALHDRGRLARHGRRNPWHRPALPVFLDDLYQEFVDNGGQVWPARLHMKPRGIGDEHLRKGSTIVGAAKVVEEVVAVAKTVAFA